MRLIILFLFFIVGSVSAQSITGTKGLLHIPSAEMYPDRTIVLGSSFIPDEMTSGYSSGFDFDGQDRFTTYVSVQLFEFAEFMFRYTHTFEMKVYPQNQYFPDRMITLRLKLLKEREFLPSVVFGLQDAAFSSGEIKPGKANQFAANYLVATKNFKVNNFGLGFSGGYAFDFAGNETADFVGAFAGVSLRSDAVDNLSFLAEYDSKRFNVGIETFLLRRVQLMIGIADFDRPIANLAYRYTL